MIRPVLVRNGCDQNSISVIRSSSRYYDIILSLVIRIFCEILCTILDSLDPSETEILYKMIHSIHLFSYTIEKCDVEFWYHNLEWNTRKSSTRANIQKTSWSIFGEL